MLAGLDLLLRGWVWLDIILCWIYNGSLKCLRTFGEAQRYPRKKVKQLCDWTKAMAENNEQSWGFVQTNGPSTFVGMINFPWFFWFQWSPLVAEALCQSRHLICDQTQRGFFSKNFITSGWLLMMNMSWLTVNQMQSSFYILHVTCAAKLQVGTEFWMWVSLCDRCCWKLTGVVGRRRFACATLFWADYLVDIFWPQWDQLCLDIAWKGERVHFIAP